MTMRMSIVVGPTADGLPESLFDLLKRERIRRQTYKSRDDAGHDVFDYIEFIYNPSSKYARNRMPPPVNFKTDSTT